jgi:hypothetical protein
MLLAVVPDNRIPQARYFLTGCGLAASGVIVGLRYLAAQLEASQG